MKNTPTLPVIERDFWGYRSAEAANAEHPDTFIIPTIQERANLQRGNAAKLLFEIETEDESGVIQTHGERMWVIVLKEQDGYYLGILDNEPSSIEPGSGYLQEGCFLWFKPEHVASISTPPGEYLAQAYPEEFAT